MISPESYAQLGTILADPCGGCDQCMELLQAVAMRELGPTYEAATLSKMALELKATRRALEMMWPDLDLLEGFATPALAELARQIAVDAAIEIAQGTL
jgi:hypothetical protein